MLEKGLYSYKLFPKIKFGKKNHKSPKNLEHKKKCQRIQNWIVRQQKDLGVKAFETGIKFQYLDLLNFKTNSCFQLYTSQQPTPSHPWGQCLEKNQDGWDLAITNSTTLFLSYQRCTFELWAGLWAEKDKACFSVSFQRPEGLAEMNKFIYCSSLAHTAEIQD